MRIPQRPTDPSALGEDRETVRRLLASPEARKVFSALQSQGTDRLRQAAQAAMQGDPTALQGLMQGLDQDTAQAVESLDRKLRK